VGWNYPVTTDQRVRATQKIKMKNTVRTAATLHDTVHRYEASAAPVSALAARRAFFAALAAAAFAFFASAFAAYNNRR